MMKKVVITAALGAAVVGAGGAALAAAPGDQVALAPSASAAKSAPSTGTATTPAGQKAGKNGGKHNRRGLLGRVGRLAHATWVSKDPKTDKFVTHDAIHGDVTAVSATSITVKAADGVSQTYIIGTDTRIRVRAAGKGSPGTISQVTRGEHVLVSGISTGTLAAKRIVAGLPR